AQPAQRFGRPDPCAPGGRGLLRLAMPFLHELTAGQSGRVEEVLGQDAMVQRLMEMGILEGEEIEVLGFAPLGDPMEIRLRDYRLSLRRTEAARVGVNL